MELGLNEKTALVTGSGRGIGASIAKELAAEGVKVIITDINEEAACSTIDEIKSSGGEAYFYHMNVAEMDSVTDCVKKVQEDSKLLGQQATLDLAELEEAAIAMRSALGKLVKSIEKPG